MTFWERLGLQQSPGFNKVPRLGPIIKIAVVAVMVAVVVGGIATLIHFLAEVLQSDADDESIRNIGLILVAALGAPFVVWRAIVAHKQANIAEQRLITDQINKSVDGLGAEKTVNKIGRPAKIYTGKSNEYTYQVDNPSEFVLEPKSVEVRRYHDDSLSGADGTEVFSGKHIDVRTWEKEFTEIEWQGVPLDLEEGDAIAEVGDWSVFTESRPNIEVRVGAIYALERIAQDSQRDHIQIMEILTAYIRENAPVADLVPSEEPFERARPRADIQAALDVIGRRSPDSIAVEHSKRYRLDLRNVDLSGADFSKGNFEGVLMFGSRLEAANFRFAVKRHLHLRVKTTPSVTRTARFGGRTPPKSRRQNLPVQALSFVRSSSRSRSRYERPLMLST